MSSGTRSFRALITKSHIKEEIVLVYVFWVTLTEPFIPEQVVVVLVVQQRGLGPHPSELFSHFTLAEAEQGIMVEESNQRLMLFSYNLSSVIVL